jgi:hypothetical protein
MLQPLHLHLDTYHSNWAEISNVSSIQSIYVGISGLSKHFGPRVAIAISNATYLVDYLEYEINYQEDRVPCSVICDSIVAELERYTRTYLEKIMGVALPKEIYDRVPNLCSRLWTELDCIPFVMDQYRTPRQRTDQGNVATFRGWNEKSLDEQADSMVRKCIRYPWLPLSILSLESNASQILRRREYTAFGYWRRRLSGSR